MEHDPILLGDPITLSRGKETSTTFFQDMLGSIAKRGRHLIDRAPARVSGKKGRKSPAHSSDKIQDLAPLLLISVQK